MKGILSFALGLVALSPIAVSAEELNRRLYPNATDRTRMTLSEGMFSIDGDVLAFERNGDTYTVLTFGVFQDGVAFGVSYDFNCDSEEYHLDGMSFASKRFEGTPFVETMGFVRFYGRQFCAIDRGMRR